MPFEKEQTGSKKYYFLNNAKFLTFLGRNSGIASTWSPGKNPTVSRTPKPEFFDAASAQKSSNITCMQIY
jgi:hypothetical protein